MVEKPSKSLVTQTRKRLTRKKKMNKVIIFDLDETIGYFQELSQVYFQELELINEILPQWLLFQLLDENPKVFRKDIFSLFKYLKQKKQLDKGIKVVLFTNNQGPIFWYNYIVDYIHHRLNYKLFNIVIGPYKIGNEQIEEERTSHNKSIYDLSNILNLKISDMRIIMFDDQHHTYMNHKNVLYIHLNKYTPYSKVDFDKEYMLMKNELERFLRENGKTKMKNKAKTKKKGGLHLLE